MSKIELLKIQKTLLETLTIDELKDFVFDLIKKASGKKSAFKKQNIPRREATEEEAKLIQEGLDSGIASQEEVKEVEELLGINLLKPTQIYQN